MGLNVNLIKEVASTMRYVRQKSAIKYSAMNPQFWGSRVEESLVAFSKTALSVDCRVLTRG